MIDPKKPIIISFWGSDLLRGNPENYFDHLKIVKRANAITLHSQEMREVLLAKFGREYYKKIRITLFGTSPTFFKHSENISDWDSFILGSKKKWKIPLKKFVITIGHSAMDLCNHLPILE